jgi:hypothetical protein
MPIRDRDYFNEAWRRWYHANKERKLEWQARRRRELKAWLAELKATKQCLRCAESAPECLQFHHRDPTRKDFDIWRALARGWSRPRILAEIEKCDVLCANCHLIHHWTERQTRSRGDRI